MRRRDLRILESSAADHLIRNGYELALDRNKASRLAAAHYKYVEHPPLKAPGDAQQPQVSQDRLATRENLCAPALRIRLSLETAPIRKKIVPGSMMRSERASASSPVSASPATSGVDAGHQAR